MRSDLGLGLPHRRDELRLRYGLPQLWLEGVLRLAEMRVSGGVVEILGERPAVAPGTSVADGGLVELAHLQLVYRGLRCGRSGGGGRSAEVAVQSIVGLLSARLERGGGLLRQVEALNGLGVRGDVAARADEEEDDQESVANEIMAPSGFREHDLEEVGRDLPGGQRGLCSKSEHRFPRSICSTRLQSRTDSPPPGFICSSWKNVLPQERRKERSSTRKRT